jgi:peptidoglycan biosynthesis protein MviN/MurJ (putative lipid II flippase)
MILVAPGPGQSRLDNALMFLRAGILSLVLLVASRLLGLVRESAQAAAFGASGLADVAILMLTLPDWIVGVVASGALTYVLLPAWAQQPDAIAATQRRVARFLLGAGAALAALIVCLREPLTDVLAPGLRAHLRGSASLGLLWSAVALPMALLAALWTTRLQHENEVVGMYGANLVVNVTLIVTLVAAGWSSGGGPSVALLGAGLVAAMAARLWWLARCQRPYREPVPTSAAAAALPRFSLWLWAALAAGLPQVLPFAGRSIASSAGEGALATFSYAWKLVELPLVLAIQLVATLAFPSVARAFAAQHDGAIKAAQPAIALAWALACAAAAVLLLAAPALAQLLFGWGRMDPAGLALVAGWAGIGAWGLLPQAVLAVLMTVLAAQGRMRTAVIAHALAAVALVAAGILGFRDGASVMAIVNVLLCGVAVVLLAAVGPGAMSLLPARAFAAAVLALGCCAALGKWGGAGSWHPWAQLAVGVVGAFCVLLATAWASPELRAALRR